MARISHQEKAVAARLRREFAASRPAFSEDLHGRLREAIRRQRAGGAKRRGHRVSPWALVAAAACLLIAASAAWQAIGRLHDSGARRIAGVQRPGMGRMTGLADNAVAKTGAAVDAAAKAQRWAYLDQDARTVLQMPAARLPLDVVSSLLSVPRRGDARARSSPPASSLERNSLRGPAGARDG
jgi:hypothetical protein